MRARNQLRTVGASAVFAAAALAGAAGLWRDKASAPVDADDDPTPAATVAGSPTPVASPTPTGPRDQDVLSADELAREGRYGEARQAFLALAGRLSDPVARADALLGAGNAAFVLNDTTAGFQSYKEAIAAAPEGANVWVRANYSLLRELNNHGRAEDALAMFSSRPKLAGGSPLEPYYRFEGARAQPWPAGEAAFDTLIADPAVSSALRVQALREVVARWRSDGDREQLAKALSAYVQASSDRSAQLELARLYLEAGNRDASARELRDLVAGAPASSAALVALELATTERISEDPGAAGLVLYRHGAYDRAVDLLTPALDSAESPEALAFRAFYLAASYEDLGEDDLAIAYYDRVAASGAASSYVHRARYWAARVAEGASTPADASARYVALVVDGPPGEFSQESAFRAGYVLLADGDGAGALAAWAQLDSATSPRLEYWRGRALAVEGDAAGAQAAFQRAMALGPLDLYGLEAGRELGLRGDVSVAFVDRDLKPAIDWPGIAAWLTERVGPNPVVGVPTAACELMAAGLRDAARSEIWSADNGNAWRRFALMREAHDCALTDVAAQLAVNIRVQAGVASHEPPRDLLRLAYPVDFASTLETESQKAGLDPLFFASLVRQESFWDPSAGSSAGALGLTQVIPPTGRALASELGVIEFAPEMLFFPAISLEFGAHYLGAQVKAYGNPWVALAGYNAGPVNAARWAASGVVHVADLVETIDFNETRNYVTYIYEAYAHYQLAWGA